MAAVTIRNIPDETHRALKARAARNGRSTEAEIRDILRSAVAATHGEGVGDLLAGIGKRYGGFDVDIVRDPREGEAADLG